MTRLAKREVGRERLVDEAARATAPGRLRRHIGCRRRRCAGRRRKRPRTSPAPAPRVNVARPPRDFDIVDVLLAGREIVDVATLAGVVADQPQRSIAAERRIEDPRQRHNPRRHARLTVPADRRQARTAAPICGMFGLKRTMPAKRARAVERPLRPFEDFDRLHVDQLEVRVGPL